MVISIFKPSKNAMLCDVQYVKQNRKAETPDYLYLIWRDLDTQEKFMEAIKEPEMDIYFEKPEYRNHVYNREYARLDEVEKVRVKYKDIISEIANDIGPDGKQYLSNAYKTRNFKALNDFFLYPYVYGADYDVISYYRIKWLMNFDNDIPKKLHKGYMDIEVDGFDVPGMPSAEDCPINAITLIDEWNKTVYTFLLTDRPYRELRHLSKEKNEKRKEMYEHMHREQADLKDNLDDFNKELHSLFDESYGEMKYKQYFYTDEKKMLTHFFQLVNSLKLDFIGIWNMSFDIPYIIDRLEALGLDPKQVMSHPDFPVKYCWFKEDKKNHAVKNKTDILYLTSYTVFYCQMELYGAIRKGQSELRSFSLNFIGYHELKDTKLDYSEDGNIKTLPYMNFKLFVVYNIKDVLLQMGIERRTNDFDTLYMSGYKNATSYDKAFRKTVTLRNVQYLSYMQQGLVPGENINIYNKEDLKMETDDDEEEDEVEDEFEGALVADPQYNGYVGINLYGRPTNNIFANAIDFDMSAFYPNTISGMNITASALIFKTIMPASQFEMFGGKMKLNGQTKDYFQREDDCGKECIDNFQTGNYLTTGHKWLNLPDIYTVYNFIEKRMKKYER